MPKWKVYISSTFRDLKDLRGVLINLFQNELQNSFELCDIMERMFDEGTQTPFVEDSIKAVLESDIYIIILGNKTGSFPPNESRTYTEIELDTAISNNKNIFCFYLDPFDEDEIDNKEKYQELRSKFDGKSDHPFKDGKELELVLLKHLHQFANKGPVNPKNPYKGLAAFNVEDGPYFFGRGAELENFLKIITTSKGHCFISVVGNSGTGKSSFVQAGVLYQLKTDDKFGYKEYKQCIITPGCEPYTNLEYQLKLQGVSISDLINPAKEPAKLILYFDQFEEVITQCISAEALEEKEKLIRLLNGLLKRPDEHSDIVVICTYRSDFISQLANFEFISSGAMTFFPLNSLDYKVHQKNWDVSITEIITKPAEENGVKIEEELVNQLLNELKDVDGSLPILEFTLQRIWNEDTIADRRITSTEFSSLSKGKGIGGIIQVHADGVFKRISANNKTKEAILKSIFVNLVEVNESQNDVRRTVEKANLFKLLQTSYPEEEVNDVFEDLVSEKSRLLSVSSERGEVIKVTLIHEALIRKWERLQQWIEERREALEDKKRIERHILDFEKGREKLYNREQLKRARHWAIENPDLYTIEIKHFLLKSNKKIKNKIKKISSALIITLLLIATTIFWVIPSINKRTFINKIIKNDPRLWEDIQLAGGIDSLENLSTSYLDVYNNLEWFDNLRMIRIAHTREDDLSILKQLNYPEKVDSMVISNNVFLKDISVINTFENLIHLNIDSNNSLNNIEKLNEHKSLISLNIIGNDSIRIIEEIGIKNLTSLIIKNNNGLKEVSKFKDVNKLDSLVIENNSSLENLNALVDINSLTSLTLIDEEDFLDISGIKHLEKLVYLDIEIKNHKWDWPVNEITSLTHLTVTQDHNFTDLKEIENLNNLKSLTISFNFNLNNIDGVEKFEKLNSLELIGNWSLRDINAINGLLNLKSLVIDGNRLDDINAIVNNKNITNLEIKSQEVTDLRFLRNFKKLSSLKLSGNSKLKNIETLKSLSSLTKLELSSNFKLSDLNVIPELSDIKTIILRNNRFKNLNFINGTGGLKSLEVKNNDLLEDISSVRNLDSLESLIITGNSKLKDISAVRFLDSLKSLVLSGNIQLEETNFFNKLINLTSLGIENNSLSDLENIHKLSSLVNLELIENNQLKDIKALQTLTSLSNLKIYNSKWLAPESVRETIESLTKLKKLEISRGLILDYKLIKENNPGIEIKLLD